VVVVVAIGTFDLPAGKTIATWIITAGLVVGAIALIARAPHPWVLVGVGILVATVTVELGLMARHAPLRALSVPASISSASGPAVDYLRAHPGRTISMTQERFDNT